MSLQPRDESQPVSILLNLHIDHWVSIIGQLPKLELWKLTVLCKSFGQRIANCPNYKAISQHLRQYHREQDKQFNRRYAIYRAIDTGDVEMLNYLAPRDRSEYAAAARACARKGLIREFRQYARLCGYRNMYWNDLLYIAARHGHMNICREIIRHGASDWITAGYRTSVGGHLDIFKLLFDKELRNSKGKPHKFVRLSMREICKHGQWHIYQWLREQLDDAKSSLYCKRLKYLLCCLFSGAPVEKIHEELPWYELRFVIDWQEILFAAATNPDLEVLKYAEKHLEKPKWEKPFLNAVLNRCVVCAWYIGWKDIDDETRAYGIKIATDHNYTEIMDLFTPDEKNENPTTQH